MQIVGSLVRRFWVILACPFTVLGTTGVILISFVSLEYFKAFCGASRVIVLARVL